MKYIKTYEQFVNESFSSQSLKKSAIKELDGIIKNTNDWGLIDDIKNIKSKIEKSSSEDFIKAALRWARGEDDKTPLDKIMKLE